MDENTLGLLQREYQAYRKAYYFLKEAVETHQFNRRAAPGRVANQALDQALGNAKNIVKICEEGEEKENGSI